ncbi:MAG: outer membrane protein assembly factor BamD [Woeseiaceae bacterium]|nr:outer membrane protein assembly factor BamD [Woeseiaceae bacterium]
MNLSGTEIIMPGGYRGRILALAGALLLSIFLAGCAGNDEQEETLISNITEAYETAQQSMRNQNYRRAIQIFEALQARFPFSELSKQIQLELMYAYYKAARPEQAIDAADQFMRENPTHERYDYALYVKALSYYEKEPGFLERRFKQDLSSRPPRDATLAFSLLKRLVERYPASPYAADSEQRMVHLRNRLAAYENYVASFYLRQGAFVAALNRAQNAIALYNGSAHGKESLDIIVAAYEGLGMSELAADARRVREHNFPSES